MESIIRSPGREGDWADLRKPFLLHSDRAHLKHISSLSGIYFSSCKTCGDHLLSSLLTIFRTRVVLAMPQNKIWLVTWKYFFEISVCSCLTLKPGFPKCPHWMSPFWWVLMRLCGVVGLQLPRILVALKAPFPKYHFPPLFKNWWVTQAPKAWNLGTFRFFTEFVSMLWWLKQIWYSF